LPIEFVPLQEEAGTPTPGLGLGPFQASPTPDPTAYSAVVDWGDGSTATVASMITAGNALLASTSGHTYAAAGNYTITTTIRDAQGFVVGTRTEPIYVYNPVVTTPLPSLTATAGSPSGPLTVAAIELFASFNFRFDSLSNTVNPAYYTAVVDWGDGSTPVDATLTVYDASPVFGVPTGGHTFTQAGTYTLTLTVRDAEGIVVDTVNPTIAVSDPLSGRLGDQSDTGTSPNDGITNLTTPTFIGNTSPGATVEVFAAPTGSVDQPGSQIATGTANGSGVWSATVLNQPMADGTYAITGEVVNNAGMVLGTASLGTVVVDTIGPVDDSVILNRKTGTAVITYQDNLSGLDLASISDLAFYHLSAKPVSNRVREPRLILPESVSVTPGLSPTSPEVVTVIFPHTGRGLPAGRYLVKIDSGDSGNGVEDAAGNALDGKYLGKFPSGDGVPGGDFLALIRAARNKVLQLASVRHGHFGDR
jgi:PKD repeat protein